MNGRCPNRTNGLCGKDGPCYYPACEASKREAAPKQEPVAWMGVYDNTDLYYRKPPQADVIPLYTTPPDAAAQIAELTNERDALKFIAQSFAAQEGREQNLREQIAKLEAERGEAERQRNTAFAAQRELETQIAKLEAENGAMKGLLENWNQGLTVENGNLHRQIAKLTAAARMALEALTGPHPLSVGKDVAITALRAALGEKK